MEGLCKFCFDLRHTILSNVDLTYRILEEIKVMMKEQGGKDVQQNT